MALFHDHTLCRGCALGVRRRFPTQSSVPLPCAHNPPHTATPELSVPSPHFHKQVCVSLFFSFYLSWEIT